MWFHFRLVPDKLILVAHATLNRDLIYINLFYVTKCANFLLAFIHLTNYKNHHFTKIQFYYIKSLLRSPLVSFTYSNEGKQHSSIPCFCFCWFRSIKTYLLFEGPFCQLEQLLMLYRTPIMFTFRSIYARWKISHQLLIDV